MMKMKMPKRSVTIAISILLCLAQSASCGEPNVVIDPEWLGYGQSATITVTFNPPCPTISVFRRGLITGDADACIFGPKCPVNHARPASIEASLNPAGNWLRFTGVNALANGRYFAICPTDNATYEATVAIGVKPRILAVEFGNPQFGARVNLTRWQGGRQLLWNTAINDPNAETIFKSDHPIALPVGDTYLTVTVGMGVDPNQEAPLATWPKPSNLFTFEAPGFDDNPSMKPRENLGNFSPYGSYPLATRFRYRLNRNSLASDSVCSLKSLAVATLTSNQRDKATIQLDFIFDPTISNLTVKNIGAKEEVPVGRACDCLFTCHVNSCPTAPPPLYDFEWSFPLLNEVSSKYDRTVINRDLAQLQHGEVLLYNKTLTRQFVRGNVVGFPHQFLLNATVCRELFTASRDMMRTQQPLWITCQVAGGHAPASRREVKFYDFMANYYRDECKTFRKPDTPGDARRE